MEQSTTTEKGAGKLVSFEVAGERYATEAFRVHSVVRPGAITRVPDAPAAVLGVTNLRSSIVPVICLRQVFGLSPQPVDRASRVVVIERHQKFQGMLVDRVMDVLDGDSIEVIEGVGVPAEVSSTFFKGFIRSAEWTYVILDVDRILEQILDEPLLTNHHR